MDIKQQIQEKRDEICAIAAKHGAYNIRIFGSVVRGQAGPDSDIDFLIDAGPTTSSWFPAGLILDLQKILGRRDAAMRLVEESPPGVGLFLGGFGPGRFVEAEPAVLADASARNALDFAPIAVAFER